ASSSWRPSGAPGSSATRREGADTRRQVTRATVPRPSRRSGADGSPAALRTNAIGAELRPKPLQSGLHDGGGPAERLGEARGGLGQRRVDGLGRLRCDLAFVDEERHEPVIDVFERGRLDAVVAVLA